jgi:uncharacterized protein (TIGR00725 family)
LGEARNVVVVASGRVVIAVGGGLGTLSEIALALKLGRPVIALRSWPLDASLLSRTGATISEVATPEEAVSQVLAVLSVQPTGGAEL